MWLATRSNDTTQPLDGANSSLSPNWLAVWGSWSDMAHLVRVLLVENIFLKYARIIYSKP